MNKIYVLFLALLVLASCSDFLEEHSTKLAYVESCSDLEELLIGGGYMKNVNVRESDSPLAVTGDNAPCFPWIHVMDDDETVFINGAFSGPFGGTDIGIQFSGLHCWQKNPFSNVSGSFRDETWMRLYERIGVLNVILGQVDDLVSDTEELRKRVKGEALFLRASYYFWLVNFYAKPYNKETATSDPGVPIKTTDHIEDRYYTRDPVAKVYEQIVTDLKASVANLSKVPKESVFQASEAAARTLLSRVYLYTGEWQKTIEQCDSVSGYQLLNLVGRDQTQSFLYQDSPELIFTQGSYCMQGLMKRANARRYCYQISDDLLRSYEPEDLRLKNFFSKYKAPWGNYGESTISQKVQADKDKKISDNGMIRYAEVILNKAEALAMMDREREAIQTLGELRANRFEYPGVLNKTGKNLVAFIREERRRELCFEGHRWFDLRRYAVSSKYPVEKEIRHDYYNTDGTLNGTFLLKKYSEERGWVLPIPDYVIIFNNGQIKDNERDEREKL